MSPRRRTRADEDWGPWTDPGQKEWNPARVSLPLDYMGQSVEYYDPQVTGVLLGPDGEPLIILTDEVTFGFARYLEEEHEADSAYDQ